MNAPPAFPDVSHAYVSHSKLACCVRCGGGSQNPIHQGGRLESPTTRVEMSEELRRQWDASAKGR